MIQPEYFLQVELPVQRGEQAFIVIINYKEGSVASPQVDVDIHSGSASEASRTEG